jgi:OOP family OmpA-OmpF porin
MKPFFRFIIVFVILGLTNAVSGQINIPGKIRDKVNDRANQHVDEAIDKGLDATEEGVEDAVTGEEDSNGKKEKTKESEEGGETPKSAQDKKATTEQPQPGLQSYTKYDFVPGDKVLFFEDFSQDAVGDFPALWTTNGSGEVRTLNNYPGNWLYMNSADNVYNLMQDIPLPDNFILEFDVVAAPKDEDYAHSSFNITLYQGEGEYLNDQLYPGTGGVHVECADDHWNVQGYWEGAEQMFDGRTEMAPLDVNKLNHVIIWVQKRRLRIYHKGQKVLDLPTVLYQQVKYNRLRFSLWGQYGLPYFTNIRFTSAAPDMRSKLLTEGKIVSYGIYFDVNSDMVKPESYGSLNEISKVLKENPDVKIQIVGHTDSDGADASNLDLSKRRAAAVKNELAKNFGIDASRMETDGKGEGQPIAANDTPSNKALNRRVEFIKR